MIQVYFLIMNYVCGISSWKSFTVTSDPKINSLVVTRLALILATQAAAPERQINTQMKFSLLKNP